MPLSRIQASTRRGPEAVKAGKRPSAGRSTVAAKLPVDSPKIRAMARQEATRRGYTWALRLILLICFTGLLKVTVQEAILKNPQFELQQVAVQTNGPLSVEKIVRATLLTRGENLLFINMREVRARLHQLPAVASVTLERDFDAGILTLRVKQRQPVAWLDCPRLGLIAGRAGDGWLVDAQGVPFPCDALTEAYAALPVIQHEALAQNTPGQPLNDFGLQAALKLVAALDARYEAGQPRALALQLQTPYSILTRFTDKTQVVFGVDDLDLQLARLDRVRDEARRRGWEIDTLNLLARQNVPVTFRSPPDLAGLQVPAARPVTAARTASTQLR